MERAKTKAVESIGIIMILTLIFTSLFAFAQTVDVNAASKKTASVLCKTIVVTKGEDTTQYLVTADGSHKNTKKQGVIWKSNAPKIATITKNGKIKGLKYGKTTMTAKYKNKIYKFTVKVAKPTLELDCPDTIYLSRENKKVTIRVTTNTSDFVSDCIDYNGGYVFMSNDGFDNLGNSFQEFEIEYKGRNEKYVLNFELNSGSLSKSVTIISTASAKDVAEIIKSKGYINGDGDYTLGTISGEYGAFISFLQSENKIEFTSSYIYNGKTYILKMQVPVESKQTMVSIGCTGFGIKKGSSVFNSKSFVIAGNTTLDMGSYKYGDSVNLNYTSWSVIRYNEEYIINDVNSFVKSSIKLWDTLLEKYDLCIGSIGFDLFHNQ